MRKMLIPSLFTALLLGGCGENEKNIPESETPTLEFNPTEMVVNHAAQTELLEVNSNAEWSVTSNVSWCKPQQSGGLAGKSACNLKFDANTADSVRNGELSFRSGTYRTTYKIRQNYEVEYLQFADQKFKEYLVSQFDTDKDGALSKEEGLKITSIDCASKGIASLAGVERLIHVVRMQVKGNALTEIDLSALKKLTTLDCSDNKLSVLDIRSNINLTSLDCRGNDALKSVYVWSGFKPGNAFFKPETAVYVEPEIVTPAGYTLVWQDEFNATSDGRNSMPDKSLWWYETGANGWGNNEIQNYIAGATGKDTCAVVSDGTLKIIAKRVGDAVYSVRMNTSQSWTYGYFEARLKLPKGKGTWPAFWMMPKNYKSWPEDGEIDIMEEVGYRPNYISSSIHCKAYYHKIGTQKTSEKFVATADSEFHVYAVEWSADFIKGYVDGVNYFTFENDKKGDKDTWPFTEPFYLKLNLAWGGDWGGAMGVDEKALPCTYEVDYVRVFQKK